MASAADPDLKVESVKLFTNQAGQVNDRVLGNPVRGESLMATEIAVRVRRASTASPLS